MFRNLLLRATRRATRHRLLVPSRAKAGEAKIAVHDLWHRYADVEALKNISIDMSDRRLTVHGERVVKEREGVLRHTTRVTGSFSYEAVLPAPVDEKKVTAVLADGVLTITMPKATEAKTTHITVK